MKWPCHHPPKTISFRLQDDIFKTVNSVFFDPDESVQTPDSEEDSDSLENVIRGARSQHRLFFDPELGHEKNITSSIVPYNKDVFEDSVVMAMESENPYADFKKSMEEMVEIHGLKDWKCFEELLGWYLRMNVKEHHRFIVDAFVDLLSGGRRHQRRDSTTSYCSAASSSFSSSSSSSGSPRRLFPFDRRHEEKI